MTGTSVMAVHVALGVDPDEVTVYRWATDRGDKAVLNVGRALALHASDASPEALRALAAAATELAEWREQQLAAGEQVAA